MSLPMSAKQVARFAISLVVASVVGWSND